MSDLVDRLEALATSVECDTYTHDEVATIREAAAELRRVREAPVARFKFVGSADPVISFEGCTDEAMSGCRWNMIMSEKLDGQRVRLVPERGEVGS